MKIQTKAEMFAKLSRGSFGSHARVWDSDEFEESGFRSLVGVRCVGHPGGPFFPHLTPQQAYWAVETARLRGYGAMIQEFLAARHVVLNGEITRSIHGYTLYYSLERTHMRPALRSSGKHVYGLRAQLLLRSVLSESSYEDMIALLDMYPGHVVEFTVFNRLVGTLRGRNCIIWEVRAY